MWKFLETAGGENTIQSKIYAQAESKPYALHFA